MTARMGGVATLVGCLLACLVACGGGSDGPSAPGPSPAPTPTPPVLIVNGQARLPFSEDTIITHREPFTTTGRGTLQIRVDWTHDSSTIDVIVSQGDCTFEQLNADECDLEHFSRRTAPPKPREIELANEPAGGYTLFVGNLGPENESINFRVTLVPTGPLASSGRSDAKVGPGLSDDRPYAPSSW